MKYNAAVTLKSASCPSYVAKRADAALLGGTSLKMDEANHRPLSQALPNALRKTADICLNRECV